MYDVVFPRQNLLQRTPLQARSACLLGDNRGQPAQAAAELVNVEPRYFPTLFAGLVSVELKRVSAVNNIDFMPQASQVFTEHLRDNRVTAVMVWWIESGDVAKTHVKSGADSEESTSLERKWVPATGMRDQLAWSRFAVDRARHQAGKAPGKH